MPAPRRTTRAWALSDFLRLVQRVPQRRSRRGADGDGADRRRDDVYADGTRSTCRSRSQARADLRACSADFTPADEAATEDRAGARSACRCSTARTSRASRPSTPSRARDRRASRAAARPPTPTSNDYQHTVGAVRARQRSTRPGSSRRTSAASASLTPRRRAHRHRRRRRRASAHDFVGVVAPRHRDSTARTRRRRPRPRRANPGTTPGVTRAADAGRSAARSADCGSTPSSGASARSAAP